MIRLLGCLLIAALVLAGTPTLAANEAKEIQWEDLIPGIQTFIAMGLIQHGQTPLDLDPDAIAAAGKVKTFDGQRIAIAGFVVPLDFAATVVTDFLLVPYIGACIHVPPPPPNQVIYVHTTKGVRITGFFDAMTIIGILSRVEMETDLADVGYRINADTVVPYEF